MSRAVAVAACLILAGGFAAAEPVRVSTGLVEGVPSADASVTVFRGIPFAAPPVGDLRWRAPAPPSPWTGVRKADRFSAACMQNAPRTLGPWTEEFMHQGEHSEDCLYLNVWAPAGRAQAPRLHLDPRGGLRPGLDGRGALRRTRARPPGRRRRVDQLPRA